ncbi:hypothetical protein [Mycobacterium sp.]|uniref:hypothetical protein n=1 Tax=Mycobacterium sp. TaxID=1785 RepID=UPI003F9C95AF
MRVDIFALIKDDRPPDEIRARVLPGLFRMAVESLPSRRFTPSNPWQAGRGRNLSKRGCR